METTEKKVRQKVSGNQETISGIEFSSIPIASIRLSPLNYRKVFDQQSLDHFASEVAQHGIISPVTLRPKGKGYELVAGERRYKAAGIAGLKEIPAVVRELADEEVTEIQLAENLQRENPHPLDEANAVSLLLKSGKTIEETAKRLGKSKAFVYSRMKLSGLIEPIQEMFLAEKLSLSEANDIAGLAPDSQQEFFDQHCKNWKNKGFRFYNFSSLISYYRYDLEHAPFRIRDKNLVPEAGACTQCPFNSAMLKTLFPEMAKKATCTNSACYKNKCAVNMKHEIQQSFADGKPDALLVNSYSLSEDVSAILESVEGISSLPQLSHYDVSKVREPEIPVKEDFMEASGKRGGKKLDKEAYEAALTEYQAELDEYTGMIETGKLLKGLFISGFNATTAFYRKDNGRSAVGVTAKQVQEAIRSGEATPELLRREIERMESREARSKEIDRNKVQLNLHTAFLEKYGSLKENKALTEADLAAVKLIIFQSLDWSMRNQVLTTLFKDSQRFQDDMLGTLAKINEKQFSYLIRMAIAGKSDSKYPENETSGCLYRMAIKAGLDVEAIEKAQQDVAEKRQSRLAERTGKLESKITELETQAKLPS